MNKAATADAHTFVTNDGVRIAYRDSGGEGVPLLMLHGWLQSQLAFQYQFDMLRPRRVITLDFRGHGSSDKPAHGYRISRLAADVKVFGCAEGSHVTAASQESTARDIPRGTAHIFAGETAGSHYPFLQNPSAFNAVLEDFLR